MKLLSALLLIVPWTATAAPAPTLARFAGGPGIQPIEGGHALLDGKTAAAQSNTLALEAAGPGAFEQLRVTGKLRARKPGLGGAIVLLATRHHGRTGPAPYLREWAAPNLKGSLGLGIDLHDPPNREPFGPLGNYRGLPQRQVSLHWDGREIVKRLAPQEFRGSFVDLELRLVHVAGGAEVTVRLGRQTIYERYFIPGLLPYAARLAAGADARAAGAGFDLTGLALQTRTPAKPRRPPVRVGVFNHVLTHSKKTAYQAEVDLPPPGWAFARVIMTIEIHDAGKDWDEWDRTGEVYVWDRQGNKRGIVPFITSYRTECHWTVDVTHFRPWLAGKTRLEIAAGTTFYKNRGYMMSVRLDFYHGTPALEPYRLVPLWSGTARYRSDANHFRDFFEPKSWTSDAQTAAAKVFVTTTGHSQVGEFTPSRRSLVFSPVKGGPEEARRRFEHTLWRDDCYLNPNRPQYGTWKYSRAGWAPGDVVRPWWVDLTPHLQPGAEAELRYIPTPYDFSRQRSKPTPAQINAANHRLRSYVVLFRKPQALVAAPTLRVTKVAKDSNAARAGLRAGDWLLSYDGVGIDTVDHLRGALGAAAKAGKKQVEIVVYRGLERQVLTIATGRMGINLGR